MNDNTIDDILRAINIVDIVSSYIPLKRSGVNYKSRCPFHEEKTASFNVNETKQIYKCFGCGKGGNAITFVRDYEKISFFEALRKIAEKAGIALPKIESPSKGSSKRDLIYTVYELANDFFVSNFKKYGIKAKKYLEKRGIPIELAEEFSIGFSLDSYSALKSYLQKNHITSDIFPMTGLFRSNENSENYDLFYDRLMFPIRNVAGKVVAFGGRSLNAEEKQYKYINSPTTDIYIKGRELYGLYLTRFEISKHNSVYISEGYLDFLRLYQKGYKNSVASLGTALTIEQINLLSRYSKNMYLLYDGDNAGIKASVKAASLIIQNGYNPHIVLLPESHDPDSFLLKYTNEDFDLLIQNSLPLVKFINQHSYLFGDKRDTIQLLLDISAEIVDHIARELFIREVSEVFKITETNIQKSIRLNGSTKIGHSLNKQNSYKYEEERKLLRYILKYPEMRQKITNNLESSYFLNEELRKLYESLINLEEISSALENPAILIERLNLFDDESNHIIDELTQLFFDDDFMDNYEELIRQVKLRKLKADLEALNTMISADPENSELLESKLYVKREITKLSRNIVRKTIFQ